MAAILTILLFTGLILLSNIIAASGSKPARLLFDLLLFSVNALLLLVGVGLYFMPEESLAQLPGITALPLADFAAVGLVLAATAVWGAAVSLIPVRRLLAQWIPVDPASAVHAAALVLSGYLVCSTALTLAQGGLEDLAATAAPAGVFDLVAQLVLFFLVAVSGVGLFTRRDPAAVIKRLGLERPTGAQLLAGVRWIILLVLLQWAMGAISAALNPGQLELLDEISGSLLQDMDTVWEWALLALATGAGEEILFRGALQPILGLKVTALLFAVAHVQYGITPITLTVLVIGIVLGRIRRDSSTTVAIFVHTGYNFTLGLLALLAGYLQSAAV